MQARLSYASLVVPALAFLMAGVLGTMIWSTHTSHVARDAEALSRLDDDIRGRGATLSYFLFERGNDMRIVADNRQVTTYFENKALGMSEEYGLLASRLAINEHFERFITDRSLGGRRIYCGMALLDAGGGIITEYIDADSRGQQNCRWENVTFPGGTARNMAVDFQTEPATIVLREPLLLNRSIVGYVYARISLKRVLTELLPPVPVTSYLEGVTLGRRIVANLSRNAARLSLDMITEPGRGNGIFSQWLVPTGGNESRQYFVVWVPVEGTPLRMISVVDAREYLGTVRPWMVTSITVGMCFLTMIALVRFWRSNSAQLVLAARLEEKTAAEETMRQKAKELQLLLDSLPGYAFFKDGEGRYITANANFCTQVGLWRDELPGRTDHELFPKEFADAFVANDARIFSGHERSIEVEEQVMEGGTIRDMLSRKVAIRDKEGRTVGLIGLAFDVTEQKRMERELHAAYAEMEDRVIRRTSELGEANVRLEHEINDRKKAHRDISIVLAAISSALFNVDIEDRVRTWNSAALHMFPRLDASSAGTPFSSLPLSWDWGQVQDGLKACRRERQALLINNLRYDRDDGRDGYLMVSMSPMLDEDDRLDGVLVLCSDITDFKLLEVQLAQGQKLQSIGQLAAGIAHEINTPTQYVGDMVSFLDDSSREIFAFIETLGAMIRDPAADPERLREHFAQALEELDYEFLSEEMPQSFRQAREGIERVSVIVRAMRSFSRVGESEKKAVNLNEAIADTIAVSRNEWKYLATVETDLDPELPLVVCLPGEMNQVLLNLVVNAAHAVEKVRGEDGALGIIRIASAVDGDYVRISVADNGCGIPKSIQNRIFDPFFTTKDVGRGTGQGLTLVYDIVTNKHGGRVHFESEEGQGSVFHIYLPLSDTAGNA